jgi:hypothetical protein
MPSLVGAGARDLLEVDGRAPARFTIDANGEMRVDASNAVGFYYTEVSSANADNLMLQWRWSVDRPIPATDQSRVGIDDRAIAVHLWFDDDEQGSLFGIFSNLMGYPRVGHLVTYVWGGLRAPDSVLANPYYEKGVIIIVRNVVPDESGVWYAEQRDVVDDYVRAFGRYPDLGKLRYVAISADTDDTGTESSARVADVVLAPLQQ